MSGLQTAHSPDRADYDWRGFASAVRAKCWNDPRGIRAIADEIGVTATDLSRAMGGQMVSAAKLFAICDWIGADPRRFYVAPEHSEKTDCCSWPNVKQEARG